ncbi:uncharacterized protein LOC9640727 isoform X2 [Selaginella moellendorffii]|uniref:uncharacterized protein LOC9640727 isoform X2 n=1 Tax=Selaginella moellendorffii TaxID=88036 RepID=UPI000D1C70FE|nr:uncharacterized protein LOC9640727 isoform X2 [Selaginella moellendorffii]|eukprot:XP_024532838.1 uncharacterized protein LOC9640727 isoform X2 [Selaginella moellendorffii]
MALSGLASPLPRFHRSRSPYIESSRQFFHHFLDVRSTRARLPRLGHQQHRLQVLAAVDPELHTVLELASDVELSELSSILYGKSFFSPVFKSVAQGDGSSPRHSEDGEEKRDDLLERLESRLLFLAADAKSTVTGRRPRYRDVLLQVRQKLKIPCSLKLPTEDLEAEIFLFLLQQSSSPSEPLRIDDDPSDAETSQSGSWRKNLAAALKLGGRELVSAVFKGGSALTMSTLQRLVAKELSGKMLMEAARYQLAREALKKGGQLVATKLESRVTMLAARQLLAGAAARYITIRSTMMLLGPILWGTFIADVVVTALGPDYLRVVRAIYALAQIRLTRTYGWKRGSLLCQGTLKVF